MGLFSLFEDLADIVIAPIEVVANVAQVITKPVAEVAKEIVESTEDLLD